MTSWHSYPKIYNVGHAAVTEIFSGDVTVEEKIDGSQFSFGKFGNEIKLRSKGKEFPVDAPEKMFNKAVETARRLAPLLNDGWTYRAEFLATPKHNTLAYDRAPAAWLIVFDINTAEETYLSPAEKKTECERLGLECVPLLFHGKVESVDMVHALMDTLSCLGGQKIEGLVAKNYALFGPDKKVLMAKHVSESFKEIHKADWKERNPGGIDIIELIIHMVRTPARWEKSIQHLKERGELENSPRDIGKLIKEAQKDIMEECKSEITDALYEWAHGKIMRGAIRGLPEWYKEKLLTSQFDGSSSNGRTSDFGSENLGSIPGDPTPAT